MAGGEGGGAAGGCGEVVGVAGVVWAVCGELARVRGLGVLRWGGLLPLLGHLRPGEMAAVVGCLGQVGGLVGEGREGRAVAGSGLSVRSSRPAAL